MSNIIETNYGKVKGIVCEGYIAYLGIPFAKPPVGELRFEPPMEAEKYDGVLLADHFRDKAIQQELGDLPLWGKEFYKYEEYNVPASEDCLYLNIWKPAEEAHNCPVAVWIHGGAFKNGYPSEIEFDGREYAKRGIILVTIAYRCNMFGFLPTPGEGIRTNIGLQDQIAALKWVYENIESFGGDAGNITLFGQSAGAMSVLYLCNSPLTKNMISKAILQSGAGYASDVVRTMNMEDAKKVYDDLLIAAGCANLEELKQIPAMELYRIFDSLPIMREVDLLSPVTDGEILPMSVDDSVDNKSMHKIPYMMGGNKNDLWMNESTKDKPVGELWDGICRLSDELTKQDMPVYVYYFAHDLPGNDEGAFHSAELWYTFGTLDRCWRPMTDEDYKLSEQMIDCWAEFMKNGRPDCTKASDWKAWPDGYKIFS